MTSVYGYVFLPEKPTDLSQGPSILKIGHLSRDQFQLLEGTRLSLQEFIKGSQTSHLTAYRIELLTTSHLQRWSED